MSTRAAVLGTGSWGTAFAATMADSGSTVHMWGRRQEVVDQVNAGSNASYLPGIELPQGIRATVDPEEALDGAEVVVLAVPSQTLRGNLEGWAPLLPPDAAVVSLMKGIELGTTKRMSEVIAEVGAGRRSSHRRRVRTEPRPRDRRAPAGGQRRRLSGRGDRGTRRHVVRHPVVPALHQRRRHRDRARRGGEERRGAGRRHGRRDGDGGQLQGVAHHPRAGRDRAARLRPGSRPGDVHGPGRRRRPHRHVHVPPVAQPDLRRDARPGDERRPRSRRIRARPPRA